MTILRPPYDKQAMPLGIQILPLSSKGYPVPWFVDRRAPLKDGDYDFRIMDASHLKAAIRENRCWICGLPIRTSVSTFVAGPMCGINRTSAEPPCHHECAVWAARACPFLSMPKRIRDESGLPEEHQVSGVSIKRNPGVVMLWECRDYDIWRPSNGGILFELGEPERVLWMSQGREATQEEIYVSVTTGIPLLVDQCDSPEDLVVLQEYVERFKKWMPS